MKKGYLMANPRVNDPEIFEEFSILALALIEKYGGKPLGKRWGNILPYFQ